MNEITAKNIGEYCLTGLWTIGGKVSADNECKKNGESVNVILRFKFDHTPVVDLIHPALSQKKINWAVGGRDKVEKLTDGQIIDLNFSGGRVPVDVVAQYKSQYATLSAADRAKAIAELQAIK
jgi:hypothetical protein